MTASNMSADMQLDKLDSSGPGSPTSVERGSCKSLISPLMRKRARSPMHLKVQELQRGGEDPDLDVCTQKRYLTEMIAADLSKLRVDQQQQSASKPTSSRSRTSFSLPAICLPPSPSGSYTPPPSGKLTDYMDCDPTETRASSTTQQADSPLIPAYVPGAASSSEQASTDPARSISCPSLQQLQREAHESPSSPTDNKLSIDLRKAALIRSLLHKSYCGSGSRCTTAQTPPPSTPATLAQECSNAPSTGTDTSQDSRALVAEGPLPGAAPATTPCAQGPLVEPGAVSCLQLTPPGARMQPGNDFLAKRGRTAHPDH